LSKEEETALGHGYAGDELMEKSIFEMPSGIVEWDNNADENVRHFITNIIFNLFFF